MIWRMQEMEMPNHPVDLRPDDDGTGIIGASPAVRELRALVRRVAPLRMPVLIEGPTGSGKELVARALHALSGRRGRFVAVNVCAVAEAMFESTLFGHVRGAFTGAVGDSAGYLAEADGGTLFLDEIGGLSPAMQVKLLRALETREFRPVGARRDRSSDFRVVAAANEPLARLVAEGRFRADLAHRLNAVEVHVPALSERRDDVPALARHFAALAAPGTIAFDDEALQRLRAHDWPGNVRELRNVVERAVALAPGPRIRVRDLEEHLRTSARGAWRGEAAAAPDGRDELVALLARCGWNIEEAARQIGVHRATVYRRMERLGIAPPRPQARGAIPPPAPGHRGRMRELLGRLG
ncbi:MAG TPA: sigma-54 dependent transcriptional regulator [Longimicrobium sp.]|jgi:DNA-binding NtrC family response regulator